LSDNRDLTQFPHTHIIQFFHIVAKKVGPLLQI